MDESAPPTLTYNLIGRHGSRSVRLAEYHLSTRGCLPALVVNAPICAKRDHCQR